MNHLRHPIKLHGYALPNTGPMGKVFASIPLVPLVSEATAPPTEPQLLPIIIICCPVDVHYLQRCHSDECHLTRSHGTVLLLQLYAPFRRGKSSCFRVRVYRFTFKSCLNYGTTPRAVFLHSAQQLLLLLGCYIGQKTLAL